MPKNNLPTTPDLFLTFRYKMPKFCKKYWKSLKIWPFFRSKITTFWPFFDHFGQKIGSKIVNFWQKTAKTRILFLGPKKGGSPPLPTSESGCFRGGPISAPPQKRVQIGPFWEGGSKMTFFYPPKMVIFDDFSSLF